MSQEVQPLKETSHQNLQFVLADIDRRLTIWNDMADSAMKTVVILGTLSIVFSLFVASFAGAFPPAYDTYVTKGLSFLSAAFAAVLSAFNLVAKGNSSRFAWRRLQKARLLYQAGLIGIEKLIVASDEGENLLGGISFNTSNSNSSSPASATKQLKVAKKNTLDTPENDSGSIKKASNEAANVSAKEGTNADKPVEVSEVPVGGPEEQNTEA